MIPYRIALAAVCAFSVASSAAFAEPTSTPVGASAKAEKKAVDSRLDSQTVVCHREEQLGTRLGAVKICHTRAEWSALAADARNLTDRMLNTPQIARP